MSRKNKILGIITTFYSIFVYAEFPISCSLNSVELESKKLLKETRIIESYSPLQERHNQLLYKPKTTDKDKNRNFFSCCFVFKLDKGQEIEIPLLKKFVNSEGRTKDKINLLSITKQSKANIVFISHDPNMEVYDQLSNLHLQFYSSVGNDTPATKNQAMLLKAINERQIFKKDKPKEEEKNAVINAMRSTDSEAGALYVLQHKYVIDNIINELCEKMKDMSDAKITSIEFHGCTTRDMCPLCFTNMNIIQYLCNAPGEYNSKNFSFLRYLKHILTNSISENFHTKYTNATIGRQYAAEGCPTKMFISSTRIDDENLNFQENCIGEQDNYLHQFRILD